MNRLTRKIATAGATLAFAGALAMSNPSVASAEEYTAATWSPRTVEAIKQDLDNLGEEGTAYTFQWGDTLSAVGTATGISVNKLVNINDINDANLIFAGNTIHLSGDHNVVTVEKNDQVVSYDVSSKDDNVKQVETPADVQETVKKSKEKSANKKAAQPAEKKQPEENKEQAQSKPQQSTAPQGRTITVEATAYSTNQPSLSDYTYTGINLRQNPNVIAVDPSVIPLGSKVHVPGFGTYIAGDTGSAIKGNRIDIHITDLNAAVRFGRKSMTVTIVD